MGASALCNYAAITSVIRLRCVDGNLGFVLLYEFWQDNLPGAQRPQRQRRDVFNLAIRPREMQNENLRSVRLSKSDSEVLGYAVVPPSLP